MGLGRKLPGEDLTEAFRPAVAVLLDDGGIRATSEAEEYRAVLPGWAWERLVVRLVEYGPRPEGTLAGRHLRAALEACDRDPGTQGILEAISRGIVLALEALDGLGESEPGQVSEVRYRICRAAELLVKSCEDLDQSPVHRDTSFLGIYSRLDLGVTFLEEVSDNLSRYGLDTAIGVATAVKRLVESAWCGSPTSRRCLPLPPPRRPLPFPLELIPPWPGLAVSRWQGPGFPSFLAHHLPDTA